MLYNHIKKAHKQLATGSCEGPLVFKSSSSPVKVK